MDKNSETDLKNILKEELENIDSIYLLYVKIKQNIEKKNEAKLKKNISRVNDMLNKFKELENKRNEVWEKFVGSEKFSSTYEAVEKLSKFHKEEIYSYLHKFKIKIISIKNLNYLIQNYLNTSIGIFEMILQGAKENNEGITYKNPYKTKGENFFEDSILINRKI